MSRRICMFLLASLCIIWSVTTYSGAAQTEDANVGNKISELKKERLDVFRQLLAAAKSSFEHGEMPIEQVISAQDDLFKAELELASTKSERIELCKKRLDNLRKLESVTAQRFSSGTGKIQAKLSAKAARLQAEIDCLREQSAPE